MKFAIPLSILPMDEIKPLGIAADEIGYDFLAVSDHLIHPETFSVPYPYTDDGSVRWEQGTDWPDPVSGVIRGISMGQAVLLSRRSTQATHPGRARGRRNYCSW